MSRRGKQAHGITRSPAHNAAGLTTTRVGTRHAHNGGGFVPNFVQFIHTTATGYLERTTVPTALAHGKQWTVVYQLRVPPERTISGGAMPIFSIGIDTAAYSPGNNSLSIEVHGSEGFIDFGAQSDNITFAGFPSVKSMQQDIDINFDDDDYITVGCSVDNNAAVDKITIFYAYHGEAPTKHTNNTTAGNTTTPEADLLISMGSTVYINRWSIGARTFFSTAVPRLNNDIALLYFDDSYIDFSVDANIAKFYRDRAPVRPDTEGNFGLGQPKICFGGEQRAFNWQLGQNLGSGGNFTHTGETFRDGPTN